MGNGPRRKRGVPEGLWIRCPQCKATIFRKEAESRYNVCPECEYHFYLPARERIRQLLDEDSFEEWYANLSPCDPLGFKDRIAYADRIKAEQAKTGMLDAAVVGRGDAGVLDAGHGARFLLEADAQLVVVEVLGLDDLHGHGPIVLCRHKSRWIDNCRCEWRQTARRDRHQSRFQRRQRAVR